MLLVYRFYEAPEYYKKLSGHGGDEDWIIVTDFKNRHTAEEIAERLVVCDYECHQYEGEVVYITAHS